MIFGQRKPLESEPLNRTEFIRKLLPFVIIQVAAFIPLLYWHQHGYQTHSLDDQVYPVLLIATLEIALIMKLTRQRFMLRRLKDIYPQISVSSTPASKLQTLKEGVISFCAFSPLSITLITPFLLLKGSGSPHQKTPLFFRNPALLPIFIFGLGILPFALLSNRAHNEPRFETSPIAYWTCNPTTYFITAILDDAFLYAAAIQQKSAHPESDPSIAIDRNAKTLIGIQLWYGSIAKDYVKERKKRTLASDAEKIELNVFLLENLVKQLQLQDRLKSPIALMHPASLLVPQQMFEGTIMSVTLLNVTLKTQAEMILTIERGLTQLAKKTETLPIPLQTRIAEIRQNTEATGAFRLVQSAKSSWIARTFL